MNFILVDLKQNDDWVLSDYRNELEAGLRINIDMGEWTNEFHKSIVNVHAYEYDRNTNGDDEFSIELKEILKNVAQAYIYYASGVLVTQVSGIGIKY